MFEYINGAWVRVPTTLTFVTYEYPPPNIDVTKPGCDGHEYVGYGTAKVYTVEV